MSKQKRHYAVALLAIVLAIGVFGGLVVMAATTTATVDTVADTSSAVSPECVSFHGNSSSGAIPITVTLPFQPGYIRFHPNHTVTTNLVEYEWFTGMEANVDAQIHQNGTFGHVNASIAVSNNVVTIPAALQTNSMPFLGRACR